MGRYLLIAIGACSALLGTGIARNWVQVNNGAIPFLVALACWTVALWGWRIHLALLTLGIALVLDGGILFFVMPKLVNNGSGQDAIDLFAMFVGGGTGLVGLCLVMVARIVRRSQKQGC